VQRIEPVIVAGKDELFVTRRRSVMSRAHMFLINSVENVACEQFVCITAITQATHTHTHTNTHAHTVHLNSMSAPEPISLNPLSPKVAFINHKADRICVSVAESDR